MATHTTYVLCPVCGRSVAVYQNGKAVYHHDPANKKLPRPEGPDRKLADMNRCKGSLKGGMCRA